MRTPADHQEAECQIGTLAHQNRRHLDELLRTFGWAQVGHVPDDNLVRIESEGGSNVLGLWLRLELTQIDPMVNDGHFALVPTNADVRGQILLRNNNDSVEECIP